MKIKLQKNRRIKAYTFYVQISYVWLLKLFNRKDEIDE